MATFSPVMRWVPSLTLPKVPYPRERPIMNGNDWFGCDDTYLLHNVQLSDWH